ncbi:MAG: hypothetical protein SOZ27_01935 [Spirochaetia bacterium]|nr:hypothetical protein [Spirochaetia bacterium]
MPDFDDDLDYDQFDDDEEPRFQSLEDLREEEDDEDFLDDDDDDYEDRFPYRNTILDDYVDDDEELDEDDETGRRHFDEDMYDSLGDDEDDF